MSEEERCYQPKCAPKEKKATKATTMSREDIKDLKVDIRSLSKDIKEDLREMNSNIKDMREDHLWVKAEIADIKLTLKYSAVELEKLQAAFEKKNKPIISTMLPKTISQVIIYIFIALAGSGLLGGSAMVVADRMVVSEEDLGKEMKNVISEEVNE